MNARVFPSLASFSRFMAIEAGRELAGDTFARGAVARALVPMIRAVFGDKAKLPPPLAEQTVERKGNDDPLIDTGDMRNSIAWAHEGTRKTIVGSTDEKAVWHELGPTNGRFPARPFLAPTAAENNDRLFGIYQGAFERVFLGSGPIIELDEEE